MTSLDELIKNMAKGNELGLKGIAQLYSQDLYLYASHIIKSDTLAEEIVADVFIELWKNRSNIKQIKNLKSWLLTVTRNKSISSLRAEKKHQDTVSWNNMEWFQFESDIQLPDEQIISAEEVSKINIAINSLPSRCKEVFVLAKIEKLPYKEISKMLNISVKTINVHVSKALRSISDELF